MALGQARGDVLLLVGSAEAGALGHWSQVLVVVGSIAHGRELAWRVAREIITGSFFLRVKAHLLISVLVLVGFLLTLRHVMCWLLVLSPGKAQTFIKSLLAHIHK